MACGKGTRVQCDKAVRELSGSSRPRANRGQRTEMGELLLSTFSTSQHIGCDIIITLRWGGETCTVTVIDTKHCISCMLPRGHQRNDTEASSTKHEQKKGKRRKKKAERTADEE